MGEMEDCEAVEVVDDFRWSDDRPELEASESIDAVDWGRPAVLTVWGIDSNGWR